MLQGQVIGSNRSIILVDAHVACRGPSDSLFLKDELQAGSGVESFLASNQTSRVGGLFGCEKSALILHGLLNGSLSFSCREKGLYIALAIVSRGKLYIALAIVSQGKQRPA